MRLSALFLAALLASCSTRSGSSFVAETPRSHPDSEHPVHPDPPADPVLPHPQPAIQKPQSFLPRLLRTEISGISLTAVLFDSRSHRLAVIDQPGGPGSQFPDAASAGSSRRALAAINAGFFNPDGSPLGLVVSSGQSSGAWNTSSLGSAIWHENAAGISAISRRSLGKSAVSSMREALQSGPLLVENHRPVTGLNAVKASARSFVAWDGGTRWMIARTSPCSLSSLAQALAQAGNFPVSAALNLDGGRSADLWVSGNIPGGPLTERPFWNKPVRNFLVLVPR